MRWEGFRKVRNQVCKRIGRRMQFLQLQDISAYRKYLIDHDREWQVLDGLCRVTISRFYRDKQLFSMLQQEVLPELLLKMKRRGEKTLRVWSAGCAAGEEPYSLRILWELALKCRLADPQTEIEITATDSDPQLLARAHRACYPYSSVKNLPADWRKAAFDESNGELCLRPKYHQNVNFSCQDIRVETPPGMFDLIMCRNLALTYFVDYLQRQVLGRIEEVLQPGGILVIGIHEKLPEDYYGFTARSQRLGVYQRI